MFCRGVPRRFAQKRQSDIEAIAEVVGCCGSWAFSVLGDSEDCHGSDEERLEQDLFAEGVVDQ